mgnify:FL=1
MCNMGYPNKMHIMARTHKLLASWFQNEVLWLLFANNEEISKDYIIKMGFLVLMFFYDIKIKNYKQILCTRYIIFISISKFFSGVLVLEVAVHVLQCVP